MSEASDRIEELLELPRLNKRNYDEIQDLLNELAGAEIFFRDFVDSILERRYMSGTSTVNPDTSL